MSRQECRLPRVAAGWSVRREQRYMHYTCPLSCGTCQHNCSDSSEHCVEWMRQGECESNTLFMLRECPVACGVCTPECSDTNGGYEAGPLALTSMCEQWAKDGACEGNPDHMLVHCPVACGVCKPKCKDLNEACSSWGGEGQCESNPKFMLLPSDVPRLRTLREHVRRRGAGSRRGGGQEAPPRGHGTRSRRRTTRATDAKTSSLSTCAPDGSPVASATRIRDSCSSTALRAAICVAECVRITTPAVVRGRRLASARATRPS